MDDTITELVELEATGVAGVASPANGTKFLIMKAADQDVEKAQCSTCGGDGKIRGGAVTCPDCGGDGMVGKSDSEEADEILETVTGEASKEDDGVVEKDLTDATRAAMSNSSFAYVDPKGGKHLPVHDEDHVHAAIGRFGQTDFSGADDPDAAKRKAARKIIRAAGQHGVQVDPNSAVGSAAKGDGNGGGPGVIDGSTHVSGGDQVVSLAQNFSRPGKSELAGAMTGAPEDEQADPSHWHGGHTPYAIPAEGRMTKMQVASNLVDAIAFIRARKDEPGSASWESQDSSSLHAIATQLAQCSAQIDAMVGREQDEVMNGSADDGQDVFDLQDADSALSYALGLVSRLAFTEAAEASAAKGEPAELVADGDEATKADLGPDQEDLIDMQITKEELSAAIASSVTEGVVAAMKALNDPPAADEAVDKNSNPVTQGGDIDEGSIKDNGTVSDDLSGVRTSADSQYVNKAVMDELNSLKEQVAKMSAQPRPGGPILDGQPREGMPSPLEKSQVENAVATLQDRFEKASDAKERARLGEELTYARLYQDALKRFGTSNPLRPQVAQ